MIVRITAESLVRISLLLHTEAFCLAYHWIVPRQVITNLSRPAFFIGPFGALLRAILKDVIPRTSTPQIGRVDGILHAHAGDIAYCVLLGHIEARHILAVVTLATLVVAA